MQTLAPLGFVALLVPLSPALVGSFLGLSFLFARPPGERVVARMVSITFTICLLATLTLVASFVHTGEHALPLELGSWFGTADYGFEASLLVDTLSVPMMLLVAIICGVIGRFSATYLVREPGQPRFYLLLCVFATGMFLLVMAGTLDLLIAGWELVGISSMLLIGFFHERVFPVRNALRAFVVYRICDIGLLVGTVLLHHYGHSTSFATLFGLDRWPDGSVPADTAGVALVALCLFWAACGKSALFPVGSWLPRAMEGPTPSSALFYGALSVHAGAYLMLRVSPLLEHAPLARTVIVSVGLLTALHGTLVARVQSDIKSQLAYATSTQVGLIFMEIGLGFPRLALVHLLGHATLRTLQFLRSPNAVTDMMLLRAASGSEPGAPKSGLLAQLFRPEFVRFVYVLSLERFYLDAFWERVLSRPMLQLARSIERGEARVRRLFAREPKPAHTTEPTATLLPKEGPK